MEKLKRLCRATLVLLVLVSTGYAQDSSFRSEFECFRLASATNQAAAGEKGLFPTFHQVWAPDRNYGTFRSRGAELVYDVEGAGSETVIVLHGGPGLPHEYFHPALSNLSRFVKLVYFDRRADVSSATAPFQVLTLDEMAEDVEALREKLGLSRVTLLGHSFGGAIALTYAARYPNRVKRLVLVNTSATLENPVEFEKRMIGLMSESDLEEFRRAETVAAPGAPCERVRARYRSLFPYYFHKKPNPHWLDVGTYSAYFDSLARKLALAASDGGFDARPWLARIAVPALVFGGRYDLVTPLDQAAALAAGLPQGRLAVMEHSGHFPFLEENYMFTQWVRHFLTGTADSGGDVAIAGAAPSQN